MCHILKLKFNWVKLSPFLSDWFSTGICWRSGDGAGEREVRGTVHSSGCCSCHCLQQCSRIRLQYWRWHCPQHHHHGKKKTNKQKKWHLNSKLNPERTSIFILSHFFRPVTESNSLPPARRGGCLLSKRWGDTVATWQPWPAWQQELMLRTSTRILSTYMTWRCGCATGSVR